jgi:hypothetical protein
VPVTSDDFTVYFGEKAPAFVPASQANVIPLDQYKHIVKEVGRVATILAILK